MGEEKENLKKEEESLTQDLKCLGEETLKTKVNVESQENELNNILEVLKNAQSHFEDLLSEEKSMKDRVLTLKSEIGDKKNDVYSHLPTLNHIILYKKATYFLSH